MPRLLVMMCCLILFYIYIIYIYNIYIYNIYIYYIYIYPVYSPNYWFVPFFGPCFTFQSHPVDSLQGWWHKRWPRREIFQMQ